MGGAQLGIGKVVGNLGTKDTLCCSMGQRQEEEHLGKRPSLSQVLSHFTIHAVEEEQQDRQRKRSSTVTQGEFTRQCRPTRQYILQTLHKRRE